MEVPFDAGQEFVDYEAIERRPEVLPSKRGVTAAFAECATMGLDQDYWESLDYGPSMS